ncbi:MAG: hypothetical protein ABI388_05535 [Bacteroidia bacterium]
MKALKVTPTNNNFYNVKKQLVLLTTGLFLGTSVLIAQSNSVSFNNSKEVMTADVLHNNSNEAINEKEEAVEKNEECLVVIGNFDGSVDKFIGKYTATLILENKVIEIQNLKVRRSMAFLLRKNTIYTIRIDKEGYISKCISISTYTNEKLDLSDLYRFTFETNLLSQEIQGCFDEDDTDFPIAIVSYNPTCDCFEYNKQYTSSTMKHMINTLFFGI